MFRRTTLPKARSVLMTKTDALLYAKEKIRVNSVHPGYIWTPMVEGVGKDFTEGMEDFRTRSPRCIRSDI